ncbi:TetR/AcrR family transcriptional regulator [Kitasatospora sp. NPDC006697]|uniref:TetR/AcrR family transcriptional regulator n=1 Tax=Kitasatospora sp. NPDC006697 TaxID=3364020 RepID=UPI0036A9241A
MIDEAEAGTALGRRERNKLRVRGRLFVSAMRLFTEKGYEQTSIDEIAEAADVARGTFFNYFQRKEDLITTWGELRRAKLREGLAAVGAGGEADLRTTLERCMGVLAGINEAEPEVTRAMLTAWVKAGRPIIEEPYAGEIFAEVVAAARDRGEAPDGVQPHRVGNLLRDGYLGTLYRWCQEREVPAGELHAELLAIADIVLLGITAERR